MMETLLENPFPAILVGGLLTAILAGGWLRTGRNSLVVAMLVAIALTIAAVLIERFVVTDREQITAALHEIAKLVEQNDVDAALDYAYSGAPQVRRQADAELRRYEFSLVDIKRNLTIEVDSRSDPPQARAEFNVVVVVTVRNQGLTDFTAARFCEVTLYKEQDGRWRVGAYSHADPQRGWMVREKWPETAPRLPAEFPGKL